MSRIKDLKNDPENTFNIIELLSLYMPVKKTKYSELLFNILKNRSLLSKDQFLKKRSEMMSRFNISIEDLEGITPYQLILLSKIADSLFTNEEWTSIGKFCQYNERGLVDNNDISTYKSMTEIDESVKIAQLKIDMKEMEKYVKKIFDDGEWVVIRPLTYQSALKYGYGTKWCTSSTDKSSYFQDYANRGLLIYVINTVTGHKIAAFRELRNGGEYSFWNAHDDRIDSMDSGLPSHILEKIREEIKHYPKSNLEIKREQELGIQPNSSSGDTNEKMIELSRKLSEARREGRGISATASGIPSSPFGQRLESSNIARFLNGNPDERIQSREIVAGFDPASDNGDITVMERIQITNSITGETELVPGAFSVRSQGEIHGNPDGMSPTIVVSNEGRPQFSPEYIASLNNERNED